MLRCKSSVLLLVFAAMTITVSLSWGQQAQELKQKHAPNALPGVEPEMLIPDYWIALQNDADTLIMTPEQIEQYNAKNRNRKVVFQDYYGKPDPISVGYIGYTPLEARGALMHILQPLELPDTIAGDSLRVWLKNNAEWLRTNDYYDGRNAIYSDGMKEELLEAANVKSIQEVIKRRFGIVVNHANVRFFPTSVPGYRDVKYEMDMFQATSILVGNPVAVLHESVNGDFYYVESPIARGWVAAENIALAGRGEIRKLVGDKNFLMAAAHRVPVYGDPAHKQFARYLYYSSTMPLQKKDGGGYMVKMPVRRSDGTLGIDKGYVKPDAEVHIGYFPYTKRNVLVQIFKLLNQPYGWIDQDNKRACSGTVRVLLRCFGIEVGYYPAFILPASDRIVYFKPNLSAEEKTAEVAKLEPAITFGGTSGHIVMLLGKARNGKLYFMHQAGWGYDEDGVHYIVNRQTINPTDFKFYSIQSPSVFSTFRP